MEHNIQNTTTLCYFLALLLYSSQNINSDLFWNHTCSGMLNGELYAQRLQKLIYLYLFTDCFMKISLQSSKQINLVHHKEQASEVMRAFFTKLSSQTLPSGVISEYVN